MRRSSSRRGFSCRPKRKLVWARDANGVVLPIDEPGGTQRFFPLSNFEGDYGAGLIGVTIMRIRGVITAALVGDTESLVQGYGAARFVARVTDHVDANSTDYVDGTLYGSQAQADWFMFEPFMLDAHGEIPSGEIAEASAASEIRHVDVRARRRLDELSSTVEVLVGRPEEDSTFPPFNTMPIRLRWDLSILVALP